MSESEKSILEKAAKYVGTIALHMGIDPAQLTDIRMAYVNGALDQMAVDRDQQHKKDPDLITGTTDTRNKTRLI